MIVLLGLAVVFVLVAGTAVRVRRRLRPDVLAVHLDELRTVAQLATATIHVDRPEHKRVVDQLMGFDLTGLRYRTPDALHWRQIPRIDAGRHTATTCASDPHARRAMGVR